MGWSWGITQYLKCIIGSPGCCGGCVFREGVKVKLRCRYSQQLWDKLGGGGAWCQWSACFYIHKSQELV